MFWIMSVSVRVYVFVDYIISYIATGSAEVTSGPKMFAPVTVFQNLMKLHLYFARTSTFRFLKKIAHANMRWNRNENVYVIRRHNTIFDIDTHLFSYLTDYISNSDFYFSSQNFIAILRYPNNVITMIIRCMTSFTVFCFHTVKMSLFLY